MNLMPNLELATKINATNAGTGLVGVSTIPGANLGLFATRRYNRGEYICTYNGDAIYHHLYDRSRSDGTYVLEVSPEFVIDAGKAETIVTPFDTGRYICGTKNPKLVNCEYYTTEYGGKFPVAYVRTTREIHPGEEFLVNYGPQYSFQDYQEPVVPDWSPTKPTDSRRNRGTTDSPNQIRKCKFRGSGKFF